MSEGRGLSEDSVPEAAEHNPAEGLRMVTAHRHRSHFQEKLLNEFGFRGYRRASLVITGDPRSLKNKHSLWHFLHVLAFLYVPHFHPLMDKLREGWTKTSVLLLDYLISWVAWAWPGTRLVQIYGWMRGL